MPRFLNRLVRVIKYYMKSRPVGEVWVCGMGPPTIGTVSMRSILYHYLRIYKARRRILNLGSVYDLLRERHPDTIIFWGQNDIFFTPEGGEAYLRDLPNAEMHCLDSGHFAVEDCLEEISNNIIRFYEGRVAKVLIRE